jgi:hypothetical protein
MVLEKTADYLKKFRFGTNRNMSTLQLTTNIDGFTLTLNANPYLKIFDVLSSDQVTVEEANERLGRSKDRIKDTMNNIIYCMFTGQFSLFLSKKLPQHTISESSKFVFTSEYNRNQITKWHDQYSGSIFLGSTITGNAIVISKKDALILSAMYESGISAKEEVINNAYNFVQDNITKGRNFFGYSTDDDIKFRLSLDYNEIVRSLLNKLQTYGIIKLV